MNHPDTILHPETFDKSQWTIECPHCARLIGFDGIFHWDWVIDAIQQVSPVTRITPMDFDGVVERKCHYIIFETKDVGVEIPFGQQLSLDNLIRAKSVTIMKVCGKLNPETFESCTFFTNKEPWKDKGEGRNAALDYVKRWFSWANKS